MAEAKPLRRRVRPRAAGALLLAGWLAIAGLQAVAADRAWTSRAGEYRVSYSSKLEPIVINRIHSWILHVETADGQIVEDAQISVDGGMPQHNHGLPTRPVMTRYLGHGDYLIEGLRFHMAGDWELRFTIRAGDTQDTVVIPLTL